jgi:hypothetical protein
MKFEKIVGFGDSWIWGDELLNPKLIDHKYAHPVIHENIEYREGNCFLGLLGKHYGVPTKNLGIPGGSLQSTMWTYLWWLENETTPLHRCAVIVGLTDPNRQTFYNPNHVAFPYDPPWNRFVHGAWIQNGGPAPDADWAHMIKLHTVLTDCSDLHKLNYRQTVLFFEGQSKYQTGPLFQFNTMFGVANTNCSTLIWPQGSLNDILIEQSNDQELFAPMKHPTEKGHMVIRDRLIKEIDCAIIAQ